MVIIIFLLVLGRYIQINLQVDFGSSQESPKKYKNGLKSKEIGW